MLLYTLTLSLPVESPAHRLDSARGVQSHADQLAALLAMLSQAGWAALLCLRVTCLGGDQVLCLATLTEHGFMFIFRAHLQLGCSTALECLLRRISHVVLFHLEHVELLGSEDGARPGNSDPADEGFGGDLIVLHSIQANKGSCATKTSLAVDSDGACLGVAEVSLTAGQELLDDGVGRGRSIREDHIFMVNSLGPEEGSIIFGLVKTDDLVNT